MLDTVKHASPAQEALNPVDYAVITQGLIAAAREMGVKLIRSAYSTIIREAADASAALFDRDGNVVAQAELIPMQLGPMSEIFHACAQADPVESLQEGDFYITNDPYSGGQHLQDVFIYSPIFFEGELVGFAGTVAHHLDLGGGNPGLTTEAVDVHAEGIIFPPTRYNHARDWEGRGPLKRMVAANIRVPGQTIGDFDAQFAANSVGAERMRQLCEKYGAATLRAAMGELVDYSERRFRMALSQLADGVYHGEDSVDDDGITDQPLTVKAAVTVKGDTIEIDFDGTCPQVSRNLNCPFSSTISAALSAVKSALTSPDIPFNEGLKRPVRIRAPKGSLVNPNYPAPVRARMEAGYRCFNAVLKALAQVAPDKVIAGGNDATLVTSLSHQDQGKYKVYLEVYGGGFGASLHRDGCDAVDSPLSNCTNTPIEATDMDFDHFRIVGYGLIPDSAGHGRHRGGLGFYRSFEILKDGVNFAMYADRFRVVPYGLFGGADGKPGSGEILRDGKKLPLKSKDNQTLRKGDIVTIYTAGGGGYGPASERAREDIEYDIQHGYVTQQASRAIYG
ncbi:hydantoinase B/oxoprolinase family protein [Pusillimonas sp. SM2304]|uniref:hydantoinase B/oxoprolinase family protein n=1 Tax=Pusillimonas sp. SM2304 TaxID=3073241 RepID=UPI002875A5E8|nr:hydantoinase B/oxoprolinase family protein [Pusillimonas sp. SM2304]MDS1139201.1 hydantoinase B/oxoprolinase family protein [Pusillimonas sp. SM2304]